MRSCSLVVLCILCAGAVRAHDKSYWEAIIRGQYAVPEGESPFALARELGGMLGANDPELRDHIAFEILNAWLSRDARFTESELVALLNEWQANLRTGPNALKRSFSALCLASLVEREIRAPFLGEQRYRKLLDAALEYLTSERDLRGFDAEQGWVHATAHTADLIAVLARHPSFTPADQKRTLTAIADRLLSAPVVFTQGEQDRLAQSVTAIVRRTDFDSATFDEWLTQLRAARRQAARTRPQTLDALAKYQNATYFLHALYTRLSMATLAGPAAQSRTQVLDVLR